MTTNAFLFMWDMHGIESIVPITRYEKWDQTQVMQILGGKQDRSEPNPLNITLNAMTLRARYNSQRHYEIYCIDCDESITEDDWAIMWDDDPQGCAELVRERGIKIYSDRAKPNNVRIT